MEKLETYQIIKNGISRAIDAPNDHEGRLLSIFHYCNQTDLTPPSSDSKVNWAQEV